VAFSTEEEESLDSIKRWWNESGKSLLIGVIVFAVGYLGWTQWQRMQAVDLGEASDLYEEIGMTVVVAPGQTLTEEARANAMGLAQQLKTEHPDSVYALYGALFGARLAVEASDLNTAETELQWLLDNAASGLMGATDESLIITAKLRLARVILSKGEGQRALDVLATITEPGGFEAQVAEVRGDSYVSMDMLVEAEASYQAAVAAGSTSQTLQMKLDDVAVGS